jgi:hypothetical protein
MNCVKGVLWKDLDLSMYFDERWAWSIFECFERNTQTHTLFSIRFNTRKQNLSSVLYRENATEILLEMNKFQNCTVISMTISSHSELI